jgi:hypothetical protein
MKEKKVKESSGFHNASSDFPYIIFYMYIYFHIYIFHIFCSLKTRTPGAKHGCSRSTSGVWRSKRGDAPTDEQACCLLKILELHAGVDKTAMTRFVRSAGTMTSTDACCDRRIVKLLDAVSLPTSMSAIERDHEA